MDIVQRNFFNLLRTGAFDEKSVVEPMSSFKWNRLYQMVEAQGVADIFARGVRLHEGESGMNLPNDLKEVIGKRYETRNLQPPTAESSDFSLSNHLMNRRLQKIIYAERHSIDTSIETIRLLRIIVENIGIMLNKGMSLGGIINLGQYLRTKGDKVDFVKFEQWLKTLQLRRMAQLQGSILIAVFGFEQEELPFVEVQEPRAHKLTLNCVSDLAKDTAEEWHFRQTSTGFVRNNGAVLRRNLRRSIRYIAYSPIETTSNFANNFIRSLSEIEE